jgi:two-component system chemotaxis response regulator CheB
MPREAAALGAATYILPPGLIAARLIELHPAGSRR